MSASRWRRLAVLAAWVLVAAVCATGAQLGLAAWDQRTSRSGNVLPIDDNHPVPPGPAPGGEGAGAPPAGGADSGSSAR